MKVIKNFDWEITKRKLVIFMPNYNRGRLIRFIVKNIDTVIDKSDWVIIVGNDNIHDDLSDLVQYNTFYFTLLSDDITEYRNSGFIKNYCIKRCMSELLLHKDSEIVLEGDFIYKILNSRLPWRPGNAYNLNEIQTQNYLDGEGLNNIVPTYIVQPNRFGTATKMRDIISQSSGGLNISSFFGGSFCVETEVLKRFHGYDERYEYYGFEDSDIFCRLMHDRKFMNIDYSTNLIHLYHEITPKSDYKIQKMSDVFIRSNPKLVVRNADRWGEWNSMKYSIIMPYYKRSILHNTLVSFDHFYKDRTNYEVIIVESLNNMDNDHIELLEIIEKFKDKIDIKHIQSDCGGYNPAPMFNQAVKVSTGEFLMLTNPECFHSVNVLNEIDKSLFNNKSSYIICSCLNIKFMNIINDFNDFTFIPSTGSPNKNPETFFDGNICHINDELLNMDKLEWYQHSIYNNRGLHFCTVISRINYDLVGGFDELYNDGIGWEDDDFIATVKFNNIKLLNRDDLVIFHMDHSRDYQYINVKLLKYNERYFINKWRNKPTTNPKVKKLLNKERQHQLRNKIKCQKQQSVNRLKNKRTSYIKSKRGRN